MKRILSYPVRKPDEILLINCEASITLPTVLTPCSQCDLGEVTCCVGQNGFELVILLPPSL